MADTVKVTLIRSGIGRPQRQKDTLKALGLRKLNATVELADSPATRGMLAKISHLIRIEEGA